MWSHECSPGRTTVASVKSTLLLLASYRVTNRRLKNWSVCRPLSERSRNRSACLFQGLCGRAEDDTRSSQFRSKQRWSCRSIQTSLQCLDLGVSLTFASLGIKYSNQLWIPPRWQALLLPKQATNFKLQ